MSMTGLQSRYEAGWRASGLGYHLADIVSYRGRTHYVFGVNVKTSQVTIQPTEGDEDAPSYNVPVEAVTGVRVREDRASD
jgi:hypothetical protein